jgi:cystathionine beta-lyase/cystathionine gamma-synthase
MTLNEIYILETGNETFADNCEKISDNYAIEFANWCVEKELFNTIRYERITTKQLLEIFKKEKGL